MKIGLVSPEEIMEEVSSFARNEFPEEEIIPVPYRSLPELPSVLSGQQNRADAFLFLGETARRIAAESVTPTVPWVTIPRSGSTFLRILCRAALSGRPLRIATDCPREEFFRMAFREIGIPPERYALYLCPVQPYSEEHLTAAADRMTALCRDGTADFCITIFYRMLKILSERNVPAYILRPSFEDIRAGIERLVLSLKLRKSRRTPLACAAFRLSVPEEQYPADRGYELAAARLTVSRFIWQFARETQSACIERPPAGWLLFSTQPLLESATARYHHLPILTQVRSAGPFSLSAGFGLGITAEEAKIHAERALEQALSRGGDGAYLMGPGISLPVPPAKGDRISRDISSAPLQEQFLPAAKRSGVSVRILTLLRRLCDDTERTRFTSAELADFISVTPRTMNRILRKLVDAGLAREAGLQFTARAGRPSRLIELSLRPLENPLSSR